MKKIDIFQFINILSDNECFFQDSIYLVQGKWFKLESVQQTPCNITALKSIYGDDFEISLCFTGNILLRAGVHSEGKSFTWVSEKTLASQKIEIGSLSLDLSRIQAGNLEISILPLEESAIFANNNNAQGLKPEAHEELYSFLSPTYELCCEEPLYYHFIGEQAFHSFEDGYVHLATGTGVDLLTYFNSFSAVKWQKYTNVDSLSAWVDFQGEGLAEIVHLSDVGTFVLASWNLQAKERTALHLPLGTYPAEGILGIRIQAFSPCILYGGGWLTDVPETQKVRLGIGITTFKREEAVKAAVSRLSKAISAHPLYKDAITITVVDNGRTLEAEDVSGATLIPNNNLGGTGGFMRNLIHYQDLGEYTHCLFMDDDASCEAGSIFRSMAFIRHATDEKAALSGAMLSENIQFLQWESGAYFDKRCHPLHCNYDLRMPEILLKNENEDSPQPVYGAWWFFIFPIKCVQQYTFPFFVRGDDIQFTYVNNFKIIRCNGVSCWQEDFKTKESPMTLYLDIRSHIIHHLVLKELDCGPANIIKMVWRFFSRFNRTYQYDTANAIVSAFSDILGGTSYWINNMDTSKIRAMIKEKYQLEVGKTLRADYRDVPPASENIRFPFCTTLVRRISLNGHLLPQFMFRKKLERLNKFQIPLINRMFLRDSVLICNEINKTEVVLKRDPAYFFSNLFAMIFTSVKFYFRYGKLKKEYRDFLATLKDDSFWKKAFNG